MTSRVDPQDAKTHAEIVAAFNVLRDGLGVTDHLSEEEAFALTRLALWAANDVRRSAVVRPTPTVLSTVCAVCGGSTALDAVVRPTRDEIAQCIEKALREDALVHRLGYYRRDCRPAADAVLALFGVAVSDFQETPTEGREE